MAADRGAVIAMVERSIMRAEDHQIEQLEEMCINHCRGMSQDERDEFVKMLCDESGFDLEIW